MEDIFNLLSSTAEETAKENNVAEPNTDTQNEDGQSANEPNENTNSLAEVQKTETQSSSVQQAELNDAIVQDYLSKRFGKEIDLSSFDKSVEVEEDELIKKWKEFKQNVGGGFEEFVRLQKDYSQASVEDVVREYLTINNPELTPDEIEFELENLLPNEDDLERDVKQKQIKLKKLHKEALSFFENYKANISTAKQEDVQRVTQMYEAKAKEQMEAYRNSLQNALNNVSKLTVPYAEKPFDINIDNKGEFLKFILEMPHWYDANGNLKPEKVIEDGMKIYYFDKIISDLASHVEAIAQEKLLKERKNVTVPQQTFPKSTSSSNDEWLRELGIV